MGLSESVRSAVGDFHVVRPHKRVVLVISDLACGGAQRVLTRLAAHWVSAGHHVTIVTLSGTGDDFFSVPAGAHRVALGLRHPSRSPLSALRHNLIRVRRMREVLAALAPDTVFSFADRVNVLTLLATRGLGVPVYVSERSDPRHQPAGPAWERLRKYLYPKAQGVIVLSSRIRQWVGEFVPDSRVHVIPNPVACPASTSHPQWLPLPCIISIGRLSPEKRFDRLVRAFAECRKPGWSLVIIGEGPERTTLEKLIRSLNLSDAAILPGRLKSPETLLSHASFYVLCSHHEGFPNALAEAMAAGIPVITVDYPAGPEDIVRNGIDGFIIEQDDAERLTEAMARLMDDPDLRSDMGRNASSVSARFSTDSIMQLWDELLGPTARPASLGRTNHMLYPGSSDKADSAVGTPGRGCNDHHIQQGRSR